MDWWILTLYQLGGGVKKHRTTINPSAVSEGQGLGSPKFLTLFLSIPDRSQRSYFWNLYFKISQNWTSKILGGPRALGEKLENRKKIKKSNFFWLSRHARGPPKIFDVHFFENFKKKFQKWLLWDMSGIERNKVMNFGETSPNLVEMPDRFRLCGP